MKDLVVLSNQSTHDLEFLSLAKASLAQLQKRRDLGFQFLPIRDQPWTSSHERVLEVQRRFKKLGVLGIGGSSLGAKAVIQAVRSNHGFESVQFFENVDAKSFWKKIKSIENVNEWHWVVISKSGNTMETLGQCAFLLEHLNLDRELLKERFTVISEDRSNALTDWGAENQIPQLFLDQDVGGRFSVFTPVGLFPAGFAGVDIRGIRQGALWAVGQDELVTHLAAQVLQSFQREEWETPFWFYSDDLYTTGLWVQQLWSESLAKKVDRQGDAAKCVSTPIPLLGANDQHSVLQQLVEGPNRKFVFFFQVSDSENFGPHLHKSPFKPVQFLEQKTLGSLLKAEREATQKALLEVGVQSVTLSVERLGAEEIGALLTLFQMLIGVLGEALDINAFDQPGVELGKRLAKEIMNSSKL